MRFIKKLLKLLQPFQKTLFILMIGILLVELIKLSGPYLFKLIIDGLVNFSEQKVPYLLSLVAGLFLVYIVLGYIYFLVSKRVIKLLLEIERYLPTLAQEKLVTLSLGYHEKENTGVKLSRVQRGVDKLVRLVGDSLWDFAPTVVQVVVTFIILIFFNWPVALLFMIPVPIFLLMTARMNKKVGPMRQKRHKDYELAYGKMGQSIFNIYTVQSFVQEEREVKEYQSIKDNIFTTEFKEWLIRFRYNFSRGFLLDAGRVIVLLFSIYMAYQGEISVGSLVFFITLSEKAYSSLFSLSHVYDQISEATEGVNRLSALLEEDVLIKNAPQAVKAGKIRGEVIFENVVFSYEGDHKEPILKDISFKIKPGERVALAGPSGGGKTTVIKLLYRHYDVNKGRVLVDGTDIRQYDLKSYRQNLAIVPQDVEMFNTTVAENIAYGKPEATQEEIEKAAQIANADQFIEQFVKGYDTLVGERGIRLSGGQRQRIGIARAILKDPSILIFDEATSNLDAESELLIQEALKKIGENRTIIIIAHRLSTIREADKILVIADGELAEEGDHARLAKRKGLYAKLSELQMRA